MTEYDRVSDGTGNLQRSSCAIKTSTRGFDLEVKVYEGSPIADAAAVALECYWDIWDKMQAELMGRRTSDKP